MPLSSFRNPAPCGTKALKHRAIKARPANQGGDGGRRGKKGGRDSERKGYYTFFIKFPGTKPHQSISEIEGRRGRDRMF